MKDANELSTQELADAMQRYESDHSYQEHMLYHKEGLLRAAYTRLRQLEKRIDQLENEVNAVEWVNGRMERELEQALRKCG